MLIADVLASVRLYWFSVVLFSVKHIYILNLRIKASNCTYFNFKMLNILFCILLLLLGIHFEQENKTCF